MHDPMKPAAPMSGELPMCMRHEFALFGANGDNGLNGISKDHERRLQTVEKRLIILCTLSAGAGSLGGAAVMDVIKSILT